MHTKSQLRLWQALAWAYALALVLAWVLLSQKTHASDCAKTSSVLLTSRASPIADKFLLSFHACDAARADCHNPRNHLIYLAQSNDGADWSLIPNWIPYQGSVPDVIRRGDTLYVYTPNQVKRYRFATDTWEAPVAVRLAASMSADDGYVDPSLFLDEQGRLVLFYLPGISGQDPASCARGERSCTKYIRSAIEVPGSDGTLFAMAPGDRATVALRPNPVDTASDPDIFFDGQNYVLYVSRGPSIQVFTSSTLHGTYALAEVLSEGYLTRNNGGVPAGHFDSATNQYWTYATAPNGRIRRAVHFDFSKTLSEADWTTTLSSSSFGLSSTTNIESPGFAVNAPATAIALDAQSSPNAPSPRLPSYRSSPSWAQK